MPNIISQASVRVYPAKLPVNFSEKQQEPMYTGEISYSKNLDNPNLPAYQSMIVITCDRGYWLFHSSSNISESQDSMG